MTGSEGKLWEVRSEPGIMTKYRALFQTATAPVRDREHLAKYPTLNIGNNVGSSSSLESNNRHG